MPKDYYKESRRLKAEAMTIADGLKTNPLHFSIRNGIKMDIEVTKSDMKTILAKNTKDDKFNAIKNAMALDIRAYMQKASYMGWRDTIPGKHPETAYFVYFSRRLGTETILCVRKMKLRNVYKPYAIIDRQTFDHEVGSLKKGNPPL